MPNEYTVNYGKLEHVVMLPADESVRSVIKQAASHFKIPNLAAKFNGKVVSSMEKLRKLSPISENVKLEIFKGVISLAIHIILSFPGNESVGTRGPNP